MRHPKTPTRGGPRMKKSDSHARVRELAQCAADDLADEAMIAELDDLLRVDPEARAAYLGMMDSALRSRTQFGPWRTRILRTRTVRKNRSCFPASSWPSPPHWSSPPQEPGGSPSPPRRPQPSSRPPEMSGKIPETPRSASRKPILRAPIRSRRTRNHTRRPPHPRRSCCRSL